MACRHAATEVYGEPQEACHGSLNPLDFRGANRYINRMRRNRVAILLVILLAGSIIMPALAAAGLIHNHDLDNSHHGLQYGSCCTDKILDLSGNTHLIIPENQSFFQQLQPITPRNLFVADIFQPPRS